jgi:hypothetical protein
MRVLTYSKYNGWNVVDKVINWATPNQAGSCTIDPNPVRIEVGDYVFTDCSDILPPSVKTEIIHSTNYREWKTVVEQLKATCNPFYSESIVKIVSFW